jgi:hypothetical protein
MLSAMMLLPVVTSISVIRFVAESWKAPPVAAALVDRRPCLLSCRVRRLFAGEGGPVRDMSV